MFQIFISEKTQNYSKYLNKLLDNFKRYMSTTVKTTKTLVTKKLTRKIQKKLYSPSRFTKNLIGQWQYNRRWRQRWELPGLTIEDFLTLPQAIVKRWIFFKKRRLSGKFLKRRPWRPFLQWTRLEKKLNYHRKRNKIMFKSKLLQNNSHTRHSFVNRISSNLSNKQRVILINKVSRFVKNNTIPVKFKQQLQLTVKYPQKTVATIKTKFISSNRSQIDLATKAKELDYKNFVETGYLRHENDKTYNKILVESSPMIEDLPIFALDLYNLYLSNLEQQNPIKLQKWITKAYKNKTNKCYKKLLLDYTKLLKTFYTEIAATRIEKKTAAHNAVQLINQFSRVAGSRTINPLNKRWRFLSAKTFRFYLRHKHFQKFWRTKKSLFKMKVVMARLLSWLYNTTNTKYLLGVKLRNAFFQNYKTDKHFIYKKKLKLHLKAIKTTRPRVLNFSTL